MKHGMSNTAGGSIQHVLDDFCKFEIREHKKDGKTAVASLKKIFHEVSAFDSFGNAVILSAQKTHTKLVSHAYHVAAALQFLVLAAEFQRGNIKNTSANLSIAHFPKEKQRHAQESVDLVLGDLALVLMHNLLIRMPAKAKVILKYEAIFSELTKEVFSRSITEKRYDILKDLKEQATELGKNLI